MIFSRIAAGVCQSMRRSTRKPRLNHDVQQVAQVGVDGGEGRIAGGTRAGRGAWRRSPAVAPGARLRRRKNSCARAFDAPPAAWRGWRRTGRRVGCAAAATRVGVGLQVSVARKSKKRAAPPGRARGSGRGCSRAMATPEASPRPETSARVSSSMSSSRLAAEQRPRQQLPALLGDGVEQLLEKRDVQSAALPPWTKQR